MSFNDEELTALGMQKKYAYEYKQACKREVDSAKSYLDSFDARIDGAWSKAERQGLIQAKREARADFQQKLAELREANAKLTSANEQFQRRLEELKEQSASRGSTMYDRRSRSGQEPTGGKGQHDFHGKHAGKGHSTQYYGDNYRLSRDTGGQGDQRVHWTKQDAGGRKRHQPPPDAVEGREE